MKWKVAAMNIIDQVSLLFVGVCVLGIVYLVVVEPIRQRLHGRDKRKPKH